MLEIEGTVSGEYFNIFCKGCGTITDNEYLGYDPGVPHFRATCHQCGKSREWKLSGFWRGLPSRVETE